MCGEPKPNMHLFKNVQKLNKKKLIFLAESKERH